LSPVEVVVDFFSASADYCGFSYPTPTVTHHGIKAMNTKVEFVEEYEGAYNGGVADDHQTVEEAVDYPWAMRGRVGTGCIILDVGQTGGAKSAV
jgi:hypothetical protein